MLVAVTHILPDTKTNNVDVGKLDLTLLQIPVASRQRDMHLNDA